MYLQNLSILNFKNYEQAELVFSPKINCFTGNNGTGKTNILDAIYYLSFCKSFFNAIDSQNIRHNENFFVIQGDYSKDEQTESIYCGQKLNQKKIFKRNKKEYSRLADHIGLFPLVMISPTDINLILEGSEERRRFMDSVISQYDKAYLEDLISYNKVLTHRNKLLKDFYSQNYFDHDSIEIWDEQMVSLGIKIYKKRLEFISNMLPIFQDYYDFISINKEEVRLIYQTQIDEESYARQLKEAEHRDKVFQYTTVGIHKDDLILNLGDYLIKKIGSQGQQKTYLVALKLAQFDFIKNVNGFKPVLLLDDIFDKLDSTRVTQIINLVAEDHFGQVFITDTSKERIEKILSEILIDHKLFHVDNGAVEEL